MTLLINADFESYSEADLKVVGASRYSEDPTTEILCLAWAKGEDEPELWIPGSPPPHKLFALIAQGAKLSAFNALFEMQMWENVCHRRMDWPQLQPEHFVDTQGDCLALGLPANLDQAAVAMGIRDGKDKDGHRIMLKLCKPCKPSAKHPFTRWTKEQVPEDYHKLYRYCQQDVRVERELARRLPYRATSPGHPERKVWLATMHANRRGIPIDTLSLDAINGHIAAKTARLVQEMQTLTGGIVTAMGQKARVLEVVNAELGDKPISDMQGATLVEAIKRPDMPERAKKILTCYVMANYASIAKFKKMAAQLCEDDTIKDNHRYHGAATGRDAGRGVQTQNFPRAAVDDPEFALQCVRECPLDEIEALFGNILELASALCRPVLAAPNGMKFLNADLSQIEARMTAWVALEEDILQAYRDGLDAYKVMASTMYHVPYEEVTKLQRQAGKVGVLLAGFQGGEKAVLRGAAKQGIHMESKEAIEIVNAFRSSRPKLVKTWAAFGNAARDAVKTPGEQFTVETNKKFSFVVHQDFLFMKMPNGRILSFPQPRWEQWMMPWGETAMAVTHMWCNTQKGNKWERRAISGASLMQSAVQGLSRDVLMEAVLRLDAAGYPHIFRVHDEETACVPDEPSYDLDTFARLFEQVPAWCSNLPVACDPWQGFRYHK